MDKPSLTSLKQSLLLRSKTKKLQELIEKRDKYRQKLTGMYKNFRGVVHESAVSELKYSEIKVYEDLLNSVVEEINKIENAR